MHRIAFDRHKSHRNRTMLDGDGHVAERGRVKNHPTDLAQLHDALPEEIEVGLEGPGYCRRAIGVRCTPFGGQ